MNDSHWEWMVCSTWQRLHYIADESVRERFGDTGESQGGHAICGVDAVWNIPGPHSRIGLPRCAHCCKALGIPRGNGIPLNERAQQDR